MDVEHEKIESLHRLYDRWKDEGQTWRPMKVIRREPETDEERMASRIGKRLWELKMAAEEHGLEWELVELFATCDGKAQRLINLGESNER